MQRFSPTVKYAFGNWAKDCKNGLTLVVSFYYQAVAHTRDKFDLNLFLTEGNTKTAVSACQVTRPVCI